VHDVIVGDAGDPGDPIGDGEDEGVAAQERAIDRAVVAARDRDPKKGDTGAEGGAALG